MKINRALPLEMFSFDATTLTANYQVINSDGFEEPCFLLRITNTCQLAVLISFDGITDHDVIGAHESNGYNVQMNAFYKTLFKRFTKVYVKYTLGAGKSGDIYVTGYTTER